MVHTSRVHTAGSRSVVDSSAAISGLGCRGAVISSLARKRN